MAHLRLPHPLGPPSRLQDGGPAWCPCPCVAAAMKAVPSLVGPRSRFPLPGRRWASMVPQGVRRRRRCHRHRCPGSAAGPTQSLPCVGAAALLRAPRSWPLASRSPRARALASRTCPPLRKRTETRRERRKKKLSVATKNDNPTGARGRGPTPHCCVIHPLRDTLLALPSRLHVVLYVRPRQRGT